MTATRRCAAPWRGRCDSGFEPESFASVEALQTFGAVEQGACLVLDVDMPDIGGFELRQALIASGRDRPTVFMTASGREGLDTQLARLGPVAVLHKPFIKEDMLDALRRAIG